MLKSFVEILALEKYLKLLKKEEVQNFFFRKRPTKRKKEKYKVKECT